MKLERQIWKFRNYDQYGYDGALEDSSRFLNQKIRFRSQREKMTVESCHILAGSVDSWGQMQKNLLLSHFFSFFLKTCGER